MRRKDGAGSVPDGDAGHARAEGSPPVALCSFVAGVAADTRSVLGRRPAARPSPQHSVTARSGSSVGTPGAGAKAALDGRDTPGDTEGDTGVSDTCSDSCSDDAADGAGAGRTAPIAQRARPPVLPGWDAGADDRLLQAALRFSLVWDEVARAVLCPPQQCRLRWLQLMQSNARTPGGSPAAPAHARQWESREVRYVDLAVEEFHSYDPLLQVPELTRIISDQLCRPYLSVKPRVSLFALAVRSRRNKARAWGRAPSFKSSLSATWQGDLLFSVLRRKFSPKGLVRPLRVVAAAPGHGAGTAGPAADQKGVARADVRTPALAAGPARGCAGAGFTSLSVAAASKTKIEESGDPEHGASKRRRVSLT